MTILYCVLTFLLGVLVASIVISKWFSGILKIYVPDIQDEPPYLSVELNKSVGSISEKKYVLFKVDLEFLNTQK